MTTAKENAKKEARKLAREIGARLEFGTAGAWYDIQAFAPGDMVWGANDLHGISGGCYSGMKSWRDEAWADVLERMQYGLAKCENSECDTCHPDREDT